MTTFTTPLVSVVSIAWNNAEGVARTLESLRRAREVDDSPELFEVLIVDGGSTDHTAEIVRDFDDVNITFISEPDNGIYDAMNKGTFRSTGEYVQYLNSGDELMTPDTFVRIRQILEGRGDARLPIWMTGRQLQVGENIVHEYTDEPHNWWRHALGIQPHAHQAIFFRRSFLELIGGYSESFDFVADFDLVMKAGMLESPLQLDWHVARFALGGMSDERSQEIPQLIQNVRVERMNLDEEALALDNAWRHYTETDSLDDATPEVRMYGLKRRAEHEGLMFRSDMHWDMHNS